MKSQTRQLCTSFVNAPKFVRAGLTYAAMLSNTRKQRFETRYTLSVGLKERGNCLFQQARYNDALVCYEQALTIFQFVEKVKYDNCPSDMFRVHYVGSNDLEKQQIKELELKLFTNLAACYLKLGYHSDTIKSCDEALTIDPQQAKALYRRAKATLAKQSPKLQDFELALQDISSAKLICPKDLSLQQEYSQVKQKYEQMISKQRQANCNQFRQPEQSQDMRHDVFGSLAEGKASQLLELLQQQAYQEELQQLKHKINTVYKVQSYKQETSTSTPKSTPNNLTPIPTPIPTPTPIQTNKETPISQTQQGSQGEQRTFPKQDSNNVSKTYIAGIVVALVCSVVTITSMIIRT